MTRSRSAVLALVAVLLSSMAANADPIYLGSINGQAVGSGSGSLNDPQGVIFVLGYPTSGTFNCAGYVGCERIWNIGENGSFDFSSSNAAFFDYVVNLMTDGVDQDLSRGAWTHLSGAENPVFPGSVGAGPESFFPFLQVRTTIDFLRLIVTDTTLTSDSFGVTHSYIGEWQVWGSAPVPEPSTFALFAVGLAALGLCGRRRSV